VELSQVVAAAVHERRAELSSSELSLSSNRVWHVKRLEAAHRYDVPVERGFVFITDTANWSKFWPGYVRLEDGSSWGAVGDTARLTTRLLGRERQLTMTITAFEPNRLVTYNSTQPGLPDAMGPTVTAAPPPRRQARLQGPSVRWLVELEEDAHGSLERAAESDQPACLREVNLGVVRHQRGACRVEAETRELIEPPAARAKLLGLAWLDLGLDLLGLFHTLRVDPQARPVMGHPAHRHVVSGTARREAARRRRHSEAQRPRALELIDR
jgi:hypothetical protein